MVDFSLHVFLGQLLCKDFKTQYLLFLSLYVIADVAVILILKVSVMYIPFIIQTGDVPPHV